jgi:hypothetical protein
MIFSENRFPARIKSGAGFFLIMLGKKQTAPTKPAPQSLPKLDGA